jgi:regulator of protease activity HflC (stomatin/prohibitin superfamily)
LNEYGLDYSGIFKSVDQSPYTSGIHFLGFQHSFIRFPKSVQTVDFTNGGDAGIIESRTQDGLEVLLEISFQYELEVSKIYELYMNFDTTYQNNLILISIDVINKVSNNYTAYDFFVLRNEISGVMEASLTKRLRSEMGIGIKFFQLKDVDLPNSFEDAIQTTEVKKQDIEKAKAEKSKVVVEIETKLQKAKQNQEIILNKAYGEANRTTLNNYATVKSFNVTERSIVDGLKELKSTAEFNNQQLLNYIESKIIENYKGSHMIISI